MINNETKTDGEAEYREAQIMLNYGRMWEARSDNNPVLEETFERRMNTELEVYLDLLKRTGGVVLAHEAA